MPTATTRATAGGGSAVWVGLVTVYVGWGTTYVGLRVMVETIPPLLGSGLRYLAAGLVLLAVLAVRRGTVALRLGAAEAAAVVLVGVLLLIGGNALVAVGEQSVPSGLAALLVTSMPLFMIVCRVVLRDPPTPAALAGVLLGFVGVAILLLPETRPSGVEPWAMGVILLAALLWAVGSVVSGRLPMPADVFVSAAYQLVAAGVVSLVIAVGHGEVGRMDHVSGRSLAGLAYLIVAGSLVTFSAYVWLLRAAPLSLVSTYPFVNPLVAVLLGAVLLDEQITLPVLVGGGIVVAAVALVVTRGSPRAAPATETTTLGLETADVPRR